MGRPSQIPRLASCSLLLRELGAPEPDPLSQVPRDPVSLSPSPRLPLNPRRLCYSGFESDQSLWQSRARNLCSTWASTLKQSFPSVLARSLWVPNNRNPSETALEKDAAIPSSILAWEIPRTERAWRATVHGVAKRRRRLGDYTTSEKGLSEQGRDRCKARGGEISGPAGSSTCARLCVFPFLSLPSLFSFCVPLFFLQWLPSPSSPSLSPYSLPLHLCPLETNSVHKHTRTCAHTEQLWQGKTYLNIAKMCVPVCFTPPLPH